MGMGFAWYPREVIREELASGQLVPLPLVTGAQRAGSLYLVHADRDGAGPGARRLAELLREAAAATA
jgi:DNA-binding transcriptional LysR family regulator